MYATAKEEAKHLIESLRDEATMDDIMCALSLTIKFQKGEREIREGKGIDDETARKKLQKWSIMHPVGFSEYG